MMVIFVLMTPAAPSTLLAYLLLAPVMTLTSAILIPAMLPLDFALAFPLFATTAIRAPSTLAHLMVIALLY